MHAGQAVPTPINYFLHRHHEMHINVNTLAPIPSYTYHAALLSDFILQLAVVEVKKPGVKPKRSPGESPTIIYTAWENRTSTRTKIILMYVTRERQIENFCHVSI